MRFSIVRLTAKRAIVARQRLLEPRQSLQCEAATVQRNAMVRIAREGEVYLVESPRIFAAPIGNEPEQVQAVEMIGLRRENFLVNHFGLGQSTGLKQHESFDRP